MQQKRIKLIRIFQLITITSLVSLAVIIMLVHISTRSKEFEQRAETMRADYVAQQKALIKREVERVVAIINERRSRSEQETQSTVKQRVYEGTAIAENIYQQNKSTKSDEEIQQLIVDALRAIRFAQGTGYYFIVGLDGVSYLHADHPDFEGTSVLDLQDTQRQFIVRDMIDIATQTEEGFYRYHWTKPAAADSDHKKISYIKQFEPFDWFIGTGLYVEDEEAQIKTDLLTTISKLRFGKDGYIFINRLNGDALVANGNLIYGTKKLWEVFDKNPDKTKALFAQEYDAALKPEGDYIYYLLSKLTDPDKEFPKSSFIYGIPDLQWLVGAGVYLDNVETKIAALQTALEQRQLTEIQRTVLATGAVIVFILIAFYLASSWLKKDLASFVSFFDRMAHEDKEIDRENIRFEELYRMAGNANTILHDKLTALGKVRLSEEQYRNLFDTALVGFFRSRLSDGLFLDVNAKVAEQIGYKIEEIVGKMKTTDLFQDISQRQKLLAELEREGEVNDFEVDFFLPSGRKATYSLSVRAYPDKGYMEGVAVDITQRKQAEEEVLKLRKLESVGVLAGGIAHDFNNLLSGLFGNIELAKRFLTDEDKAYKYLESAGLSMDRATGLTQQLLTFAKGGDPIKEPLSLEGVVTETAEFSLRGSNVKLQLDINPKLWLVDADKGQLGQVVSNLVINAKQAMPDGGIMTITAENIETTAGQQVKICVQDQGIGVAPQHLDKIFDPYFSTKQQGSGLGLASCYSIINKHNGTIVVESELNKGTTFTIILPAAEEQEDIPVVALVAEVTTDREKKSAHILVLDDEDLLLQISSAMLEEMGHRVDSAMAGEEAVTKYRMTQESNQGYDIVICDLTIPGGMGGQEAAQQILSINPQAKLIVSSGYATDPVMANYREYGFQGRIAKPYRFTELETVVQQVVEG
ncbi:MAG: cache domain-containing protein [Desulfuromusa sp.]|jgi:two-component system cell cycle sensor histidine kinase/response regulator CckA|nr:cache domain-containing protein [Desulfuromusa sp.]